MRGGTTKRSGPILWSLIISFTRRSPSISSYYRAHETVLASQRSFLHDRAQVRTQKTLCTKYTRVGRIERVGTQSALSLSLAGEVLFKKKKKKRKRTRVRGRTSGRRDEFRSCEMNERTRAQATRCALTRVKHRPVVVTFPLSSCFLKRTEKKIWRLAGEQEKLCTPSRGDA